MANLDRHVRTALRKELARVEQQRAQLDAVISYLRDRLHEGEASAPPEGANGSTPSAAPKPTPPGRRVTAAAAAEKILAERARPMRTPDLLVEVQSAGAKMSTTDNLYRTLVGNPTFRRVGRGLWALAEWPDEPPRPDLARLGERS